MPIVVIQLTAGRQIMRPIFLAAVLAFTGVVPAHAVTCNMWTEGKYKGYDFETIGPQGLSDMEKLRVTKEECRPLPSTTPEPDRVYFTPLGDQTLFSSPEKLQADITLVLQILALKARLGDLEFEEFIQFIQVARDSPGYAMAPGQAQK